MGRDRRSIHRATGRSTRPIRSIIDDRRDISGGGTICGVEWRDDDHSTRAIDRVGRGDRDDRRRSDEHYRDHDGDTGDHVSHRHYHSNDDRDGSVDDHTYHDGTNTFDLFDYHHDTSGHDHNDDSHHDHNHNHGADDHDDFNGGVEPAGSVPGAFRRTSAG